LRRKEGQNLDRRGEFAMRLDRDWAIVGLIYIWVSSTEKSLRVRQALNLLEAIVWRGCWSFFENASIYRCIFWGGLGEVAQLSAGFKESDGDTDGKVEAADMYLGHGNVDGVITGG
jgi:hypothetical protein